MNPTPAQIESLSHSLGMEIGNFFDYSDGFSFTVETELEAYKAAYKYLGSRVVVKFAPNVNLWSVQVYQGESAMFTLDPVLVRRFIRKMQKVRKVDTHLCVLIAKRFIKSNVTTATMQNMIDQFSAACWNSGAIE